ncbi:keratin, type I cytoskeletal 10-like [Frieseomelitta varia]|uniref:keratin, type I cytoskeletal 10-like n=1 Tax=Frieseomelitta varia TaxID=561572 RepID=UPI001CB68EDE|nr:keratin, type I cytoskeletal 10-like [Frieseomelitta varia]XP_043514479.1 keratin, type I cytoskeletal 10-like [Frieseomelitta varia]
MGWIFLASTLLFCLCAAGLPLPQGGGGAGGHGQPQAGSPSTPGPGGGTAGSGASSTLGAAGGGASGSGTGAVGGTGGGAGGGAAGGGPVWSTGPARRGRGWRDWRRGDPTLIKGLWQSRGPLDSLGKAEVYIFLALLIGFVTVVVGCWLSDNCWSPEPEGVVTLA